MKSVCSDLLLLAESKSLHITLTYGNEMNVHLIIY